MNYKKITSSENDLIKRLKKLGQAKYRQEYKQFLVENYVIIHDALQSGFDFEALFVSESFLEKHPAKADFLFNNSKAKEVYVFSDKLNKNFSELDCPSGIAALYERKESAIDLSVPAVYLNGVSDPGNVGTIMRTALAFGYKNIVLDSTCADNTNPKTISAAKDAIFKLNILEDADDSWLLKNKDNYLLIAANSNAGKALSGFKPERNFCLVLGSESHGLSQAVAEIVDENIRIEISKDMESLNVATAAAILLYELNQV